MIAPPVVPVVAYLFSCSSLKTMIMTLAAATTTTTIIIIKMIYMSIGSLE